MSYHRTTLAFLVLYSIILVPFCFFRIITISLNISEGKKMKKSLEQMRYEYALTRVEELLPLVNDETPANDPLALELAIMSDCVIGYEKMHYPMG